jgi:biopolymer transport protein ExbD
MPKVKVPRKSTAVDMTAMCDVAFLLLSFFILTTKFKSDDGLGVVTPNSVSTKATDDKNVVMVTMDKEGKAYFSVGDNNTAEKQDIIDMIDQGKNLGLSAKEKAAFARSGSYVGVPFSMLKSYLDLTADQVKNFKPAPAVPGPAPAAPGLAPGARAPGRARAPARVRVPARAVPGPVVTPARGAREPVPVRIPVQEPGLVLLRAQLPTQLRPQPAPAPAP